MTETVFERSHRSPSFENVSLAKIYTAALALPARELLAQLARADLLMSREMAVELATRASSRAVICA